MSAVALIASVSLWLFPAPAGFAASGVYGVVTKGPTTPFCTAERPCSAPAKGVALEVVRNGSIVRRTVTGPKGGYRVALRPGRYTVRLVGVLRRASKIVVVGRGRWTRLDLSYDTGIR